MTVLHSSLRSISAWIRFQSDFPSCWAAQLDSYRLSQDISGTIVLLRISCLWFIGMPDGTLHIIYWYFQVKWTWNTSFPLSKVCNFFINREWTLHSRKKSKPTAITQMIVSHAWYWILLDNLWGLEKELLCKMVQFN